MTPILFVPAFGFVMVGLGWLAVERFDNSGRLTSLERVAVSFVVGILILYLGVFFTAPFRLDALSIWPLLAACTLGALFGWKKIPWARWFAKIGQGYRGLGADIGGSLLWVLLIGIALSSIVQALAPPNDYDGLAYHLAFPRLDVEIGKAVLNLKTGWPAAYFPTLGSHLTRVALVVSDHGAAQMIHALFGVIGAIAAAAITMRLGYGKKVALAAAIVFLSVRMVVWQMGSVETDVPIAALAALSLVIYLAARENKSGGLEIIFGLMVGSAILMKYHGLATILAMVPLIVYDLVLRRKSFGYFLIAPAVALIVIAPHLIRNSLLTGNPIFPLMNGIFNPDKPEFLNNAASAFGTGRGFLDLLTAPWNIAILPTHFFDGMVIGGPFFLALCPLVLMDKAALKKWAPALSYVLIYFILWFWLLSQQVRFLAPVMPVLSGLAVAGAAHYWAGVKFSILMKSAFVAVLAVLTINQAMFVGIFSIIRLPAALGIVTPEFYHNNTPTMTGAYYSTCKFVEAHLNEGERYFVFAPYVSYYCPQSAASLTYFQDEEGWWLNSTARPQLSKKEFLRRLNEVKFRFFLIQDLTESRGRIGSMATVLKIDRSDVRFGNYLGEAFKNLTPLKTDKFSAVYDGKEVLEFLNNHAAQR